jgi:hypothetical protein
MPLIFIEIFFISSHQCVDLDGILIMNSCHNISRDVSGKYHQI